MANNNMDILYFVPIFKNKNETMTGGEFCNRYVVNGLKEKGLRVKVLILPEILKNRGFNKGYLSSWEFHSTAFNPKISKIIYRELKKYNDKIKVMIFDSWLYRFLWPIMMLLRLTVDFKIIPYSLHCHWPDFKKRDKFIHRMITYAAFIPGHYQIGSTEAAIHNNLGIFFSKNKSKVIFPGCDFVGKNVKQANFNKLPLNIISVGSFSPRKQYHVLIQAMVIISKKYPEVLSNLRLYLVGNIDYDSDYVAKLQRLINKFNLSKYVVFKNWPSRKELSKLLSQSQLFALASKNEAFGMVALEAMYHGLPILIGDFMSANELLGKNPKPGYVVDRYDPKAFAKKIIRFYQHEEKEKLGKRARQRAEEIGNSWKEMVNEYYKSIKKFL